MTTYLGKSCSFGLLWVPFVNCRQFMYLVISLLVLRAGCGIWLYQFLIIVYHFTFHFLVLTLYPSLFCHVRICPDLSFNLTKVFGSVWLASLFLHVSSMVTMIKYLRGHPGLPLPALLAKKFSCCVSYYLVEVGDHGVQISIFIY